MAGYERLDRTVNVNIREELNIFILNDERIDNFRYKCKKHKERMFEEQNFQNTDRIHIRGRRSLGYLKKRERSKDQ